MEMDVDTYLDEYIDDGQKETLSLRNLYDTILVGDANNTDHIYRTSIGDFFLCHYDELESILQIYTCPEEMFYKPKALSLELYDTTEMWLALLRANGMKNITEFHLPIIRVYEPDSLKEMIKVYFKREGKM